MPVATVSESDWAKGIFLSVLASILGAASKLAIRKSWLLQKSMLMARIVEQDEMVVDDTASSDGLQILLSDQRLSSSQGSSVLDLASSSSSSGTTATRLTTCCTLPSLWPAYGLRFGGMMGMTIFNPLCCVLAMNYASPSILAPFSGLTLVWIIALSDTMIQERASSKQMAAAALIILGEIVVSLFGDHTNDANVTVQAVVRAG